jgi:hypothetical protein
MAVSGEGQCCGLVSEKSLNNLEVGTGADRQRGARVAQIVQPDAPGPAAGVALVKA